MASSRSSRSSTLKRQWRKQFRLAGEEAKRLEEEILAGYGRTPYELTDESKGLIGSFRGFFRDRSAPHLARLMQEWRRRRQAQNDLGKKVGVFKRTS